MRIPRARYTAPIVILALLLALALAAPHIARHGLIKVLGDGLGVPVNIEDVELDLLAGAARIVHLHLSGESGSELRGAQLYADIAVTALFRRELVLEKVHLEGIALQIVRSPSGETVVVVPLSADEAASTEEPLEWPLFAVHELNLVNVVVDIDLPPLQGRLQVDEATLSTLTTLQQDPATLRLAGDWNGAPLLIQGSLSPFQAVPWFEGEASLQRIDLAEAEAYLPPPLANLSGTLDVRVSGRISGESLAVEGNLRSHQPRLSAGNLEAYGQSLAWQGRLDGDYADSLTYSLNGIAEGTGIGVADRSSDVLLIELSEFVAEGLSVDESGALALAELDIDSIRAVDTGSEEDQFLQGSNVQVRSLDYRGNRLRVDSIVAQDTVSNIYFSQQGGLAAQGVLAASLQTLRSSADEKEDTAPLQWSLKETSITNSRITLVDQQLDPPFRLELSAEELQLGTLDSTQPQLPAALSLKASVGEFGRIELAGKISALAPASDTELRGSIKSLALPDLSPYSEHLLGYELVAGQYDHELELSIKDSHITATNELELRRARVRKLENAQPAAPLPMPLDSALDMLRDKSDDIVLSVPLDGQLDDPDIGLEQVVSRALGKALRAGSTAFLKFVLQPYGAIWTGVEFGLKQAGKVRLDPMAFPPGSAELGASQLDYATKLGTLLSDRPGIDLQLCGVAGRDDYLALVTRAAPDTGGELPQGEAALTPEQRKLMLELAELRSSTLKRWLITEKSVAPERLYPCKPVFDIESEVTGIQLSI